MKPIFKILVGLGGILGLLVYISTQGSISFQSLESQTEMGAPVFNEIKWFYGSKKEIWMMKQSHHGANFPKNQWDRLAIVVDKTQTPTKALFYQLKPGKFVFEDQDAQPFKARCLACHPNGPRAIRINRQSTAIHSGILDQIKAAIWNLRIKTYGRVQSAEGIHFSEGISFQSKIAILSKPLPLGSCVRCHSSNGIRNPLTLEQLGTVNFLVKNGMMPPFPFSLTKKDLKILSSLITEL